MPKSALSLNLSAERHRQGLSQEELAAKANISRVAYANLESGKSTPRSETLYALAEAFEVTIEDLLQDRPTLREVRFRSSGVLKSRDQILARTARWLTRYNELEELLNAKKEYRIATRQYPRGREGAIQAAMDVRKDLDLPLEEPIRNIGGLLEERVGAKLLLMNVASDEFFGLSVGARDGGPAIVVNHWERISVERWIFSAIHELGHLVLHLGNAYSLDQTKEDPSQEEEANVFAAAFLMPPTQFSKELANTAGLPLIDRVFHLKRIFKVSYKTILMELKTRNPEGNIWSRFLEEYTRKTGRILGKTDEPIGLDRTDFCSVLAADEPRHLDANDLMDTRLKTLVRRALDDEKISFGYAAEILELDQHQMRELASMWVDA
jgi:Zn-dependent peptidase ImmA (M78 family)/DNA-binding XRE family transcriptional regulator